MILKKLRVRIYYWRRDFFRKRLLKNIIKFSQNNSLGKDQNDAFQYIEKNGLSVFPHSFSEKYKDYKVEVFFENSLPYVFHKERKLFFKKGWSVDQVKHYYKSLVMEQDDESPHLYCDDDFKVEQGDIIIDLGVAEGNFSLDHIEKASRVILFEHNKNWIEPLNKTFEHYKHKVEIINKFAGSKGSESSMAIDSLEGLEGKSIFIKIDVDGSEDEVLVGMERLLVKSKSIKVAICTYHLNDDANKFEKCFKKLNFHTSFSAGYMLFFHDKKIAPPYLRRGVLRAWKKQ